MVVDHDIIYISKSQTLEQFSKDGEKDNDKGQIEEGTKMFFYMLKSIVGGICQLQYPLSHLCPQGKFSHNLNHQL